MAKIRLEFHATRMEIAAVVLASVKELGLWLAFERSDVRAGAELVAAGGVAAELEFPSAVSDIILSTRPIQMIAKPPFGLIGNNRDGLSIQLGMETSEQLGESDFGAMTDDADSLSKWRKIRKKFVSVMSNDGISVVNTMTGASAPVRDHYYSQGAKQLYLGGKKLAGPTEVLTYKLE